MSVWLICTYYSFIFFEKLIINNKIKISNLIALAIITSFLLSIRIAGILIFIQYIILLILYINIYKQNLFVFLRNNYLKIILFSFIFFLFILIFNPIFWVDPFLLIETIKINTNHFNNVGTNTFGKNYVFYRFALNLSFNLVCCKDSSSSIDWYFFNTFHRKNNF